jgi:hypothetical protein
MELINYFLINQENGDILLTKELINNYNYSLIYQENGDILLKKNKIILNNIIDLKNYNFYNSLIIECSINNIQILKLKYKSILNYIYHIINCGFTIIKNTKLNIKTIEINDKGFYHLYKLGISIQSTDSNKCLFEIINQCINNKLSLHMKIKLKNNLILDIIF